MITYDYSISYKVKDNSLYLNGFGYKRADLTFYFIDNILIKRSVMVRSHLTHAAFWYTKKSLERIFE